MTEFMLANAGGTTSVKASKAERFESAPEQSGDVPPDLVASAKLKPANAGETTLGKAERPSGSSPHRKQFRDVSPNLVAGTMTIQGRSR
ncbi:hypothetical protein Q5H94_20280 [Sphingomonas sp. CA1-15]|uniref:Uncharacterized protein n=1 Tax=Sphingomonas immobilis TaxID=3063997 RepID=A0ABT9A4B0_9SPHN|nr:hypothetical protein [Sphingomonas sp. CA1-15]